jgi:sulfatase modifying factor 1
MRTAATIALSVLLGAVSATASGQQVPAGMAVVDGASYDPFYPDVTGGQVTVESFALDVRPVTNAEFLAFVQDNSRWRRGTVPELFADGAYLSHWASATELGDNAPPGHPVTWVSWFAASAYCREQGKELPSEAQWEWAARASRDQVDASREPAFNAEILAWYAQPSRGGPSAEAGSGEANLWGVRDLHGLVWEWVSDFNSAIVSSDSRQVGDREMDRFCGGAAANAANVADYAAFMRFAFRSSLSATYAVHNLGFRCALDLP